MPLPFAVMVSQEFVFSTLHAQPAVVVTVKVLLFKPAPCVRFVGETRYVQPAPICVRPKGMPPTLTKPERGAKSVFAARL